jgi:hypothetical protein
MSKNIVGSEGPQVTLQHGAYALRAGLARLYTCMRKHKRPGTNAHTHKRAHTKICNTYCFSKATIFRERASLLRYTYIVCLVICPSPTQLRN